MDDGMKVGAKRAFTDDGRAKPKGPPWVFRHFPSDRMETHGDKCCRERSIIRRLRSPKPSGKISRAALWQASISRTSRSGQGSVCPREVAIFAAVQAAGVEFIKR